MTIILYDIPSATTMNAWSLHVWRTRFALNFKGISYKTEWIEYPDIEPHAKKHGIAPTAKKLDGSPFYTLPAIFDPSTGAYVSESTKIAEYLEKTYPDTPSLFPDNTLALQLAFTDAFFSNHTAMWPFILPVVYTRLNPASQEYFSKFWHATLGKKLEDMTPTGEDAVVQWSKFESELGKVDAWYAKNGGTGPFLLGETPSWGDFVVGGFFIWMKIVFGADSQRWKDIASWQGGRWEKFLGRLEKYQTVV